MKIRYKGTGTIRIEGAGDVSHGELIEVPDQTAVALLNEQPQHFEVQPEVRKRPARGGE